MSETVIDGPQDRLGEIRKAVQDGHVGHLVAQRDFWMAAAGDLLALLDETCQRVETWRDRTDDAHEQQADMLAKLHAINVQLTVIAENHRQAMTWLKTWMDLHPGEKGGARIAAAHQILEQGLSDLPDLIDLKA